MLGGTAREQVLMLLAGQQEGNGTRKAIRRAGSWSGHIYAERRPACS